LPVGMPCRYLPDSLATPDRAHDHKIVKVAGRTKLFVKARQLYLYVPGTATRNRKIGRPLEYKMEPHYWLTESGKSQGMIRTYLELIVSISRSCLQDIKTTRIRRQVETGLHPQSHGSGMGHLGGRSVRWLRRKPRALLRFPRVVTAQILP
jgi:hypothetical protein